MKKTIITVASLMFTFSIAQAYSVDTFDAIYDDKIVEIVENKFGAGSVESLELNRPDHPLVKIGSLVMMPFDKRVREIYIQLSNGIRLNCYAHNINGAVNLTRCQVSDLAENDSISFD